MEDVDLALLINPRDTIVLPKFYDSVAYEVRQMVAEGLVEGQIEYIRKETEVVDSRSRQMRHKKSTYFILPYTMDAAQITDIEKLYDLVRKWRDEMVALEMKRITLARMRGYVNESYLKKIIEYVFRGTEIEVTIITKKGNKKSTVGGIEKDKVEKLIVKEEGRTFTEILKGIKNRVNLEETGAKIHAIRKTNKGDLLIEVAGGTKKPAALREAILREQKDKVKVIQKTNDTMVHITGIDASTEME